MGTALGLADGSADGTTEGTSDGEIDGTADGLAEGAALGAAVGTSLGDALCGPAAQQQRGWQTYVANAGASACNRAATAVAGVSQTTKKPEISG